MRNPSFSRRNYGYNYGGGRYMSQRRRMMAPEHRWSNIKRRAMFKARAAFWKAVKQGRRSKLRRLRMRRTRGYKRSRTGTYTSSFGRR